MQALLRSVSPRAGLQGSQIVRLLASAPQGEEVVDVVIVGGGMVGAALAALLGKPSTLKNLLPSSTYLIKRDRRNHIFHTDVPLILQAETL